MDKRTEEKKSRLLQALEKGVAMVHLDARRPGVIVPAHLKHEAHLLLNLSYRYDPPDLSVGDWGVRSTLTFSGKRFTVALPWSSLYAISSHVTKDFWMYPDDMPKELLENAAFRAAEAAAKGEILGEKDETPEESPRAILREVAKEPLPEGQDAQGPSEPSPPRKGHLRLVK